MFKRLISMVLAVVMALSVMASVTAADINQSGGSADSKVILDINSRNLKVTVPSVLPIWVDSDNNVTVATNAKIQNRSDGPVDVTNVSVEADNNWSLVSFNTDFSKVSVDTKQYGMTMYNDDVIDGVDLSLFDHINGFDEIAVVYDGNVAIQSSDIDKLDIGHVVFTVGWNNIETSSISKYTLPRLEATTSISSTVSQERLAIEHELTLDGSIGLSFYIPKALVDANNVMGGTIDISWGQETNNSSYSLCNASFSFDEMVDYTVADVVTHADADSEGNSRTFPIAKAGFSGAYYKVTAYVSAKGIADTITLIIHNSNKDIVLQDIYSVADYCDDVVKNGQDDNGDTAYQRLLKFSSGITQEKFVELQELCKAMLTYGAKSQLYFNYNSSNLADKNISYTYTPVQASDFAKYNTAEYCSGAGVMTYYGASVLLESMIEYTIWLRYTNKDYIPPNATAEIGGEPVTIVMDPHKGNYDAYYVRYNIYDIPISLLFDDIIVDFDGEQHVYNIGSYFYLVLSQGSNYDSLKNVITSLYNYHQAAVAYFS